MCVHGDGSSEWMDASPESALLWFDAPVFLINMWKGSGVVSGASDQVASESRQRLVVAASVIVSR